MLLTVPYLGALVMIVSMQRSLIYQPFVEKSLPAKNAGFATGRAHDIVTRTEDNLELRGWLVLAKGRSATSAEQLAAELKQARPMVLYFAGNAANRSYRVPEIAVLNDVGADVLLFDYRGYGENPG